MTLAKTQVLTIANKILNKLGEPSMATVVSQTTGINYTVLNAIDAVLQTMFRKLGWSFLEHEDTSISTTAGTRTYSLPDTIEGGLIYAIDLLNHATASSADDIFDLEFITYAKWLEKWPRWPDTSVGSTYRNRPEYWMLYQGKLYLNPVPDDNPNNSNAGYSLRIHAHKNIGLYTRADATKLDIPVGFEDVLIDGVVSRMHPDLVERKDSRYLFDEGLADLLAITAPRARIV